MIYLYYDNSYGIDIHKKYKFYLDKLDIKLTKNVKQSHIFLTLDIAHLIRKVGKVYKQILETCNSKDLFVKKMLESNLGNYIPKTFNQLVKFPVVIKPKIGMASKGVEILFFDDGHIDNNKFIVQEFVHSSYNHVAHLLCKNGKIIWNTIYSSKKPSIYDIKKGRITNYEKRPMNDIETCVFSQVIEALDYNGVCSVDYVYEKDKEDNIKIFEINPRFGGSLVYDEIDFPIFLEKIVEEKITPNIS
jgi:predicted ATP-grasp superfamily ATP-dependent carboligase